MDRFTRAEFELVPRSEQASFALREFKLPAFQSPWHFHPECELTLIVQSRGKRFVGDNISPFGPGEVVLLGSGLPHFWHNDRPGTTPESRAHSVVIQFREDCLGRDFLARPELKGVQRLFRRADRGLQFGGHTRDTVAALMLEMRGHSGLERIIDFLTILRHLVESTDFSPLSSPGFAPSLDERAGERINSTYEYVFRHFDRHINYSEVARAAGMKLSAFCHYFKRITGKTLSEFINEIRAGHASRLLIETDDPIAGVAFASGFESLSNFNRRFREFHRSSPSEFRQQHRTTAKAKK